MGRVIFILPLLFLAVQQTRLVKWEPDGKIRLLDWVVADIFWMAFFVGCVNVWVQGFGNLPATSVLAVLVGGFLVGQGVVYYWARRLVKPKVAAPAPVHDLSYRNSKLPDE
jgi:hypothetical protein